MSDFLAAISKHLDREPDDDRTLICAYTPSLEVFDPVFETWMDVLKEHDWDEDAMIATLAAEAPGLTPMEAIQRRLDTAAARAPGGEGEGENTDAP